MSTFFSLVTELETLLAQLNTILAGDGNDTVQVNGVEKDSISKAIQDRFASILAIMNGRRSYPNKAALDADTAVDEDQLAEVWNDPIKSNNGLYGFSAGSWSKSSYDTLSLLTEVENLQFTDYKNYPCFIRNGSSDISSLSAVYSGDYTKGHVYKALKSLTLYEGFETSWIMRLRTIWNDTYQAQGNHYFRVILERWTGTTWIYAFDSGQVDMESLGWSNMDTVTFTGKDTSSSRRIKAVIDLSLLPPNISGILNNSSTLEGTPLLISPNCFIDDEVLIKAKEKVQQTGLDLSSSTLETASMSFDDEFFSTIWSKYTPDISNLNQEYSPGYKRKLKYQAFKSLELYGFENLPTKLSYFWVDSYEEQHKYRLIFDTLVDGQWVKTFDVSSSKDELGIVDGEIYTWEASYQGKKIIAEIDFSKLDVNDSTTLNAADPDLIVAKSCFKKTIEQEIQMFNANKRYFNSKRKATFAFIFDDLNASDSLVYEIFQEFGFLPSYAILSSKLNAANADEYRKYYLNGCTILAHSVTHPVMSNTSISYEDVDAQMLNSKNTIESYGMKVSGWVTPSSLLHDSFLPLMEKNFGYGFTNKNAGKFDESVEPIKMGRYGLEAGLSGHNLDAVKSRIDTAVANNELLVVYGHQIPSTYINQDGTPYVTEQDLRDVLTYLKQLSDNGLCQVLSCDDAVESYYRV